MNGEDGKTLRASAFVLEDNEGRTRAELTLVDGCPTLCFYSGKGVARAVLQVDDENQSRLSLCDENGRGTVGLHVTKDGWPKLFMLDGNGTYRVQVIVNEAETMLGLSGHDSKAGAILSGPGTSVRETSKIVMGHSVWNSERESGLELFDGKGQLRAEIRADDHESELRLYDTNGNDRAVLAGPGAALRRAQEPVKERFDTAEEGLFLFDENGTPKRSPT